MLNRCLGISSVLVAVLALAPLLARADAVVNDGQVTFTLKAPQATQVNLGGEIIPTGATPIAMTKNESGVWTATVALTPNWYAYYFVVDGVRVSDPTNPDTWVSAFTQQSYVMVPGAASDFFADKDVPHGMVSTVRYYSKLLQKERRLHVYTPPGYGHDPFRRYPVFFLQHGGGGNDSDWIIQGRANYIFDNLLAERRMEPMVVVMIDGNLGQRAPSPVVDTYPTELMESVVPAIERQFRVESRRDLRAFAGLSLGGLQALSVLLDEPGEFAYVGIFSAGVFPATGADLDQNHSDLFTNPKLTRDTKLIYLSAGTADIAYNNNIYLMGLFDKYGIKYTNVEGTGGHTWDSWRHNLVDFAPRLFQHCAH